MLRIFTSLVFLSFSTLLGAQVAEPFTYDTGLNLEGLAGGSGWSAPWSVRKGDGQAAIAEGGVAVTSPGVTSTTPHLFVRHEAGMEGIRAARLLAAPVTDDGNTYYISWYQDSDYDVPADNGSVAQVMLVNDVALGAGGPGGQLVRMGKIFGTERFGVDGVAGAAGFIDGSDTRDAMLVVVAITMSGDAENETLNFYLNPDPEASELAAEDADLSLSAALNNGFDALGFKVEGTESLDSRIDELRFGNSVAAVLGNDAPAPPQPPTAAATDADNFNSYAAGETLDGLEGGLGWEGPWVTVSGDDPTVTEGGLENLTTLQATSGNHVTARYTGENGDSRYFRRLSGSVDDDGSAYYFSYTSRSSYTDINGQADFFMFIDASEFGASGPQGQLFQVGKPQNSPFIGAGFGATAAFSLTDAMATDVNLVVVKLQTNGSEEPDTVSIFINPATDGPEPVTADAVKVTDRLNTFFDAVGFKVTGAPAGNEMEWDDVLVGTSFAAVLPQDRVAIDPPTPPVPSTGFAVETFNAYTAGDTLGGLAGGSGWAGPWMAMPSSDNSIIRGNGLLNNALAAGTSGNSLRLSADGVTERSLRIFESPLDTTDNADFWFSAHLGAGGGPAGTVGNLILVDTTRANQQQVIIGKQFGNQNIFAVGDGQVGGATQTGRQFDGTGASFIVGHMTRDSGRWELDLYVDPDPTATELVEDSAQIVNKRYNSGNFNGVALRIDGDGTELLFDVDDLYFGSSYTDVVPGDLTSSTPAPPGAREPFSYDTGSDLEDQDGGEGWAGPWRLLTEAGEASIQEEGIASQALLRSTAGSSLLIENYLRAVRPLEGTYGDNGREFWIGWWYRVNDPANSIAHLVLADTAAYTDAGGEGRLVQIGKLFGNNNIGIVAGGAQPTDSDATEGHFLVARIVTDGTAAADQVTLWVDPDLSTAPSADTADASRGADLTNWNGIGVIFESDNDMDTDMTVSFDELIVGFSFDEVIPGNLQELEPPNTARAAVDVFDYAPDQDLNGADGGEGWRGPWEAISGTAVIAEGSVASPRTCPEGNSATVTQSGLGTPTVYRREFFNPFGTNESSSTFYASFVLSGVAKDIGNSALVSFVSGDNNVLSIGGVPGLSSLAVIRNDERAPTTSNREVVQGTKWFVVRMDINPLTALATARVFIDPAGDAIPPDETALFTIENVSIVDGITGIEISGEGAQAVELAVDDVRAGFTYRDISCQFGSDDPNLLAYEPFNYDVNTSLINAGGENAFWNGPWVIDGSAGGNTVIVTEGSLDVEALSEEANRVEIQYLDGEALRIDRELAFPIASDGRTYWLSFLMNTTDGATSDNVGNLILRSSSVAANDGQRFIFGRLFRERLLGVAIPGGAARRSEVIDEGLHWIVARFQTSTTEELDSVTLWIDPPATATAPDTTSAGFAFVFETPALQSDIDGIRLRTEGGQSPYVTEFDEITVATDWSSVVSLVNSVRRQSGDPFELTAFPNPFADELTVTFRARESGAVTLELLTVGGRVVKTVAAGDRVGPRSVRLTSADTGPLPNGFYFLRVSQHGRSTTRKLVLLR